MGNEFSSPQEVITDFIGQGIQNDFQIEALYSIVHNCEEISDELIKKLIQHLLDEKSSDNPFYEEYSIKILASLIRRITKINTFGYYETMGKIFLSIRQRNISHSTLSFAKIYLALSLYFLKFEDDVAIKNAELCFLHYKNLIDGNTRNIDDERLFYQMLGKDGKDEEKFGRQQFQKIQEHYQLETISAI